MIRDLTAVAGFPLALNTDTLDIVTGDGIQFERVVRGQPQMAAVLMEPDAVPPSTELYYNFNLVDAGSAAETFQRTGLTFACVLMPALSVGAEYVKTHGHYHPTMPGSTLAYPEVYTHYEGRLLLLMQRRSGEDPTRLNDCVVYEMVPGRSIVIPPGYFHILINVGDTPALMGGLFSAASYPQYEPVIETRGAAYYFVNGADGPRVVHNERYHDVPPLRWLTELKGTPFEPPLDEPLWSSFVRDPDAYALLFDPVRAEERFLRSAWTS